MKRIAIFVLPVLATMVVVGLGFLFVRMQSAAPKSHGETEEAIE
jgi:hypothetical protein